MRAARRPHNPAGRAPRWCRARSCRCVRTRRPHPARTRLTDASPARSVIAGVNPKSPVLGHGRQAVDCNARTDEIEVRLRQRSTSLPSSPSGAPAVRCRRAWRRPTPSRTRRSASRSSGAPARPRTRSDSRCRRISPGRPRRPWRLPSAGRASRHGSQPLRRQAGVDLQMDSRGSPAAVRAASVTIAAATGLLTDKSTSDAHRVRARLRAQPGSTARRAPAR